MPRPYSDNDPEAYQEAAGRVTTDPDQDVWVVQYRLNDSQKWRVAAVVGSYEAAQAYMNDYRAFAENCPEDSPDDLCRNTVRIRFGTHHSPNKFYETWPPDGGRDE